MKKLLAFLFMFISALCLTACDEKGEPIQDEINDNQGSTNESGSSNNNEENSGGNENNSNASEENIEKGIKLLGEVLHEIMD